MNKLLQLIKKNLTVLLNAGSLIGTTAVTSLLGFAYWWVAARLFTPDSIGLASAMISMMSLLGTISMLGMGTLLTGELTRQPGKEWALINASLILVGGVGVVVGVIFAFLAPILSPDLNSVGESVLNVIFFALGVGLTALTMVLDQALIGILRGGLQLGRNTVFSIVKLAALIASFYLFKSNGMLIYVTWLLGNILSLTVLFVRQSKKPAEEVPDELSEISMNISRVLMAVSGVSGPLAFSGPLTAMERSRKLSCPDCGVLSPNSASYCLNCGYPFSPTVEISSVRPQLLFNYGMIGLSEASLLRKRPPVAGGNRCPECGNAIPDRAMYCSSCGYALTPTIEMPNLDFSSSSRDIEKLNTMPLLSAIKKENTRQALSAENTLLLASNPDIQRAIARPQTPLPIDAEETLNLNLSKMQAGEVDKKKLSRMDLRRSALFPDDEKILDMGRLPDTPAPKAIAETPLPSRSAKGKQSQKGSIMPEWSLLRKLGKAAVQHHVVNLILLAPNQLLPILVTVLLSNEATAYFYVSYMLANFVFSLTYSLTTVLHAVSSAQPWILAQKVRFTIGLSLLASLGANIVLQFGAGLLLSTFGHAYAEQAAWCLRILSLAVFPIIIKSHYLAICRVYDRSQQIILPTAIGSIVELVLVVVGAKFFSDGLLGLSLGWTIALALEALYMVPTVYKAAYPVNVNVAPGKKPAKA